MERWQHHRRVVLLRRPEPAISELQGPGLSRATGCKTECEAQSWIINKFADYFRKLGGN